jgi:hypothetical protein
MAKTFLENTKTKYEKLGYPKNNIKRAEMRAQTIIKNQTENCRQKPNKEKQFASLTYIPKITESIQRTLSKVGITSCTRKRQNLKQLLQHKQKIATLPETKLPPTPPPRPRTPSPCVIPPKLVLHKYNTRSKKVPEPKKTEPKSKNAPEPRKTEVKTQPSNLKQNLEENLAEKQSLKLIPNNSRVVYKVPCQDCDQAYIGETKRNLQTRIKEHQKANRKGDQKNGIAEHTRTTHHQIRWHDTEILLKAKTDHKPTLRALESLAIQIHKLEKQPLMNIIPPTNSNILDNSHPTTNKKLAKQWNIKNKYQIPNTDGATAQKERQENEQQQEQEIRERKSDGTKTRNANEVGKQPPWK